MILDTAFNKKFYVRQAVNCLLELFVNSYPLKCIFAKDFHTQFNISFVILKFSVINFVSVFVFVLFFLSFEHYCVCVSSFVVNVGW